MLRSFFPFGRSFGMLHVVVLSAESGLYLLFTCFAFFGSGSLALALQFVNLVFEIPLARIAGRVLVFFHGFGNLKCCFQSCK